MSDVFISYASEDRPRAKVLAEALQAQGLTVWWDRSILPGKTFDKVIEGELSGSACVVVLWSRVSVESQWVRAEAGDALQRGVLIPVLLEDSGIPLVFRQIQAADISNWNGEREHPGFRRLCAAIDQLIGSDLQPAGGIRVSGQGEGTGSDATPGHGHGRGILLGVLGTLAVVGVAAAVWMAFDRVEPTGGLAGDRASPELAGRLVAARPRDPVSETTSPEPPAQTGVGGQAQASDSSPVADPAPEPDPNDSAVSPLDPQPVQTEAAGVDPPPPDPESTEAAVDVRQPDPVTSDMVDSAALETPAPESVAIPEAAAGNPLSDSSRMAVVPQPGARATEGVEPPGFLGSAGDAFRSRDQGISLNAFRMSAPVAAGNDEADTEIPATDASQPARTAEPAEPHAEAAIRSPASSVDTAVPPEQLARLQIPATPAPDPVSVLMVTWAMPDDENRAGRSKVANYSRQVSGMLADIVEARLEGATRVEHRVPTTRQIRALRFEKDDHATSRRLCKEQEVDWVVFAAMEANYVSPSMGYGAWREPYYSLFDCRGKEKRDRSDSVTERRGEAFPYADGLALGFQRFVDRSGLLTPP